MPLTFYILALAIAAVWLPPLRFRHGTSFPLWPCVMLAAVCMGYSAGYIGALGLLGLGALALAAVGARQWQGGWRVVASVGVCGLALALALHRWPGFTSPLLILNARFSTHAAPYSQSAHFDEAGAGILLLALLCRRAHSGDDWRRALWGAMPAACLTTAVLIAAALAVGYVKPVLKWPAFAPTFLLSNLLFTCVAEEAFFRGFLQDRLGEWLGEWLRRRRFGGALTVACSSLLFGLAHVGGGVAFVALTSLLGLGCALAFERTRRIEAPILVHFALNAVHFLGFSYPRYLA